MAKKPLPAKRPAGGPPPKAGGAPSPAQSEAVGKFDKFGAFGLAVPTGVLAIITLVIAIGYTSSEFDTGFFGFPKKTVVGWESGPGESVLKLSGSAQILRFESHNYLGRTSEGEMDVAVLNVGSDNNVNLGDVFTLAAEKEGVRVEFVVFDCGANISRAYILLGQDVSENKERQFSLAYSDLTTLCGSESNIEVKRLWQDQIIRRYSEARSTAQ